MATTTETPTRPTRPDAAANQDDIHTYLDALDAYQRQERDLHGWSPLPEGTTADWSAADLSGCTLENIDLSNGVLAYANLENTTWNHVNAHNTIMDGSLLNHTAWNHVDATGAGLNEAELTHATLTDVQLGGDKAASLIFADISDTTMQGVDAHGCDFGRCDAEQLIVIAPDTDGEHTPNRFDHTDFDHATLIRAKLLDGTWDGASMAGADLRGSILDPHVIQEATISETTLLNDPEPEEDEEPSEYRTIISPARLNTPEGETPLTAQLTAQDFTHNGQQQTVEPTPSPNRAAAIRNTNELNAAMNTITPDNDNQDATARDR